VVTYLNFLMTEKLTTIIVFDVIIIDTYIVGWSLVIEEEFFFKYFLARYPPFCSLQ